MGKLVLSKLFLLIQNYTQQYLPNERKLSPDTIRSYKSTLSAFLDFAKLELNIPLYELSLSSFDRALVINYLLLLQNSGCSEKTRNQRLFAIQSFFKYAAREELDAVVLGGQICSIKSIRTKETVVGYLSEEATQILLNQPDRLSNIGFRDFFILFILYKTGCRVEELVNIRLFDIHFGKKPFLTLHGKGNKNRNLPLRESIIANIEKYLQIFHPNSHFEASTFLIYTIRDGVKKRMTEDNVRKIVRRYGNLAREKDPSIPNNLHPHMLRHTFAMHAFQHGVPLEILKDWLGHADYNTTRIYAKADTETKRKAIEKAFPDDGPLHSFIDSNYLCISDDELLKQLCGL